MIGATRPLFTDRTVKFSSIGCLIGLGGFLAWSTFAQLDEGVTASGTIVVAADHKQIQHLEGGIIRLAHVVEGQYVKAGEPLIELDPLQSETARDELAQGLASLFGDIARYTALQDGSDTISFDRLDALSIDKGIRNEIVHEQISLFTEQKASFDAELQVLETRQSSLDGRTQDLEQQIRSVQNALSIAKEDKTLKEQLLTERLVTIGTVQQIRREVAGLEADLSRLIGDRNQSRKSASEVVDQITQLKFQFRENISQQMLEAQRTARATEERLTATQDRLARTTITAPQSGTVLNLAHSTVGGVVSAGTVIMEIVPDTGDLIASVHLTPVDRDAVQEGQTVEAQLTAYKSFIAPRLSGTVVGVSADLKRDEATNISYYEARVKLDAANLESEKRIEIIPGMPVDTFIASGRSRSFLDYAFEPISTTFTRGTRMN
ncbi:MAG: HlyD family type I secretion periplasmic adaptor subunit [Pseudomonadota bacterium]